MTFGEKKDSATQLIVVEFSTDFDFRAVPRRIRAQPGRKSHTACW